MNIQKYSYFDWLREMQFLGNKKQKKGTIIL